MASECAAEPTASTSKPVIVASNLVRVYSRGVEEVRAVDGISFSVQPGEFTAIVGPSGAGKTTLLQLVGAMDRPTSGSLSIDGEDISQMSDAQLTRLRGQKIGFVFQHFGLMPTLTVAENVALPATFAKKNPGKRVDELLEQVGLSHRRDHRPNQLSGGEMQRAAIARALVNSPSLLLADEPTGNLDTATSERIIALLKELNQDGLTVIVVTHNEALATECGRRLILVDGKIQES